ncbi:MAG: hypothetical protein PUD54_08795 [Veillonellaceae bacterium]|nr:hypothetical protein [Veillonellaceae bacterium]
MSYLLLCVFIAPFFLTPQMAFMFDELKHDCDEKGVPAATCSGAN